MPHALDLLKTRLRLAADGFRGRTWQDGMKTALERATAQISQAVREEIRHLERAQKKQIDRIDDRINTLRARLDQLETPIQELTEHHAALRVAVRGLTSAVSPGSESAGGAVLPVSVQSGPTVFAEHGGGPATMLVVERCPMCAEAASTLVCEYNRLIILDTDAAEAVKRYDYSMCHGCGLVYAAKRPYGPTIKDLMARFDDNLGRSQRVRTTPHAVLNPLPLTDGDRDVLRSRAAKGVFVSDHLGLPATSYLSAAQRDRLANSAHVELLGSLLDLRGARVLELRPRLGSILASLQRLYGAEVHALPMFESQQFLMQELYGINAPCLLDIDEFEVPFDGTFDLIIANHIFTHAVRPGMLFQRLRDRLRPGGHLFLYNEGEDTEFLQDGKSMINTLNPFHLQAFDGASLSRAFAAAGFQTVFRHEQVCLLRPSEPVLTPMTPDERAKRLKLYLTARDTAILRLPESARGRYQAEWARSLERTIAAGLARIDDKGRLRLSMKTGGRPDDA